MKQQDTFFDFSICTQRNIVRTAMVAILVVIGSAAHGASVVSRDTVTASAPTAARPSTTASRMPTITANIQSSTSVSNTAEPTPEPVPEPTPEPAIVSEPEPEPEPIIIENKADQFSASLSAQSSSGRDANADNLAAMVRRQRAALDAQSASEAATSAAATALASGQSACDIGLRNCMKQKCGDDYAGCAGDGDTIWGDKLDACRRDVTCTGRQYAMFTAEIKADRDMNAKLSAYNKIISCGNEYNDCIVKECGNTYSKCLGKTAGDAAISKCAKIANNCKQQDSGLASRTMNVFATLRQDAEKQIVQDEKRLYEMRDKMRSQCQRLGALFDERSLVCVYTVNFFAGNSTTPTASKKMYAGTAFDCTPDWFGIDVTTFKENAYRYTRSQTSASSALMGSGLGIGVGAVTSGAIDRAIDRKKAEDAAKKAEKEHEANYGKGSGGSSSNSGNAGDGNSGGNSGSDTGDTGAAGAASSNANSADTLAKIKQTVTEKCGENCISGNTDLSSISDDALQQVLTAVNACTDTKNMRLVFDNIQANTPLAFTCGTITTSLSKEGTNK